MRYVPVIMSNGSLNVYAVLAGRTPTLKWLQQQVGGYIETVNACLEGSLVMAVNEEGVLQGLPLNEAATDLHHGFAAIVGNAVILKAEGSDLVPLSMEELGRIAAFCAVNCEQTRKVEVDDDAD